MIILTTYIIYFSLVICFLSWQKPHEYLRIVSRNHYEFSRSNHDVVTAVLLTVISVRRARLISRCFGHFPPSLFRDLVPNVSLEPLTLLIVLAETYDLRYLMGHAVVTNRNDLTELRSLLLRVSSLFHFFIFVLFFRLLFPTYPLT